MNENDVLISGAGIAGPAAAYWLRKAGFNPTVVERAPAPRPGGQASTCAARAAPSPSGWAFSIAFAR